MAAEVVDRDHVRALLAGQALRLAFEARHRGGIVEQVQGDALDRHRPLQQQLQRVVDGPAIL